MELENSLRKENEIMENILNTANNALEFGLKAILPDFIEDDVIDIKNKFLEEGFSEGIREIVNKLEDLGKSVIGIFTGNFENIDQVQRLIKENGLLDGISDLIDKILKKLLDSKIINKNMYNTIKTGKKEIISSIENGLEDLYKKETYDLSKLNEDCEEWKKQYKEKDYDGMEKTMKKIQQKLNKNKTVEEIIEEARNIENIQKYIEKKESIDNLSEKEKELIEKLN